MKFIAEIGLNYNGNFALSYELIRQAKYAGADIVKFQCGWRDGAGELNELSEDKLFQLKEWTEYFQIELMFSVFHDKAFEMVKQLGLNYYKIASRTVADNAPLVEKVLDENKTTFVSLGFWEQDGFPFERRENLEYLWCRSIYPTRPVDLINFPKAFNGDTWSGYSDHSIGIDTALIAICRGAKIVEKHFTLDKSDTTIRDHALSATPEEFRLLTQIGKEIFRKISLGV